MEFIIDRSKWRCGGLGPNKRGLGPTLLLNEDNFQCCLGLIAEQMGTEKERLLGQAVPAYLHLNQECEALMNTEMDYDIFAVQALSINDHEDLTDQVRESLLTGLLEAAGHTVKFVGVYA